MEVSKRVRGFLEQRLTSLDQIDVVMLLRKDRERLWTAPEVAAALGTAPEPAAMRLFLLASAGLLALEATGVPKYRYGSVDVETESILDELADILKQDRHAIAAITGGSPALDPVRSFADAFKLK
jgi:hypothetical protein